MWNLRNTLTPLFFVLLVAGCTAEDPAVPTLPDVPDMAGAQPVSFSLCESSATPVATRATTSPLPAGETVRVLVYRSGSTNSANFVGENTYYADPNRGGRLTPCTVDATGMVTGLGEELFLIPGQTYDIHAYSPALPVGADHKTVTGIEHGTDLLGSMLTLKLEKFTESVELAPLVHQCALTEFLIQADPTDPSVLGLSVESVKLTAMSRTPGSYTIGSSTGVSPNGSTRDAAIEIEAFNKLTDTQVSASKVVLPKATGSFTLQLEVLINGTKYTLQSPVNNLELKPNNKYRWVVTCQRQGITLSFSAEPWGDTPFDSNAGTPAPLQKPANSFMVTPGRAISFDAKRADGTALGGTPTQATVLWQTRDGMTPVIERPAHVVWDSENQRIRVYTNAKATNGGKAVIVARDAGNAELYRWLVWITPYDPSGALNTATKTVNQAITAGVLPNGAAVHTYDASYLTVNGAQTVMMDRNLGAAAAASTGCNFQHGSRMAYEGSEPLFQADGTTSYTQPALPTAAPASGWTAVTINGTIATGDKSVEDPCPYGWRVPANNGTATTTWSAFTTATFIGSASGRTYNGVNAYYPTGCWGTHRTGANGYALLFTGSAVLPTGTQPALTPLPVRCVQDATVFQIGTPMMSPVSVSDVTATTATFHCRMTSTGGATITERGYYYDTKTFTDGAGARSVKALESVSVPDFTAGVSGLTKGTTYYVQAYIRTSGSTFYSPLIQFVPSGLPVVSTNDATSSAPTVATVTATVTDTGGDSAAKRGVVYSTTSNFDPQSQGTQVAAETTGAGNYNVALTGLQPGTVYYVRAYVTNQVATAYGMQRSFTTVGVPTFSGTAYSNLMGTTVTLNSTLAGPLPTPGVTEWGFEWSTNANFPAGAETASKTVPGPYLLFKAFTLDVTGLTDNTVYYMRAYGVNTAGKGYSAPLRFITPELPSVLTLPIAGATYIDTRGKVPTTFNGEVTKIGASAPTARGFEYSTTAGFAPGTGVKLSAGSGGTSAGKFAVPTAMLESDQTYYIRAYATNSAGTGYGGIQPMRLDYIPPTFNGMTVRITGRRVNALPAAKTGTPQEGNALVIAQGYAYQEGNTSNYIYTTSPTPRLKVYKQYTVYWYITNAKGTYYSQAKAVDATYSNYYYTQYNRGTYVVDKRSGEGYEAWSTGFMSLLDQTMLGFPNGEDGYANTKWLVSYEDWSFHPNAAKFCWNKPAEHGQRWFLADKEIMVEVVTNVGQRSNQYSPELLFEGSKVYWSSVETSSMTAAYADGVGSYQYSAMGKNNKAAVRCIRKRVLPADEYAD